MCVAKFLEKQQVYNINNKRSGVIEDVFVEKSIAYPDRPIPVRFDIQYKIKTDIGIQTWRECVVRAFPKEDVVEE